MLRAADSFYLHKDYMKAQGLYELVLTAYRGSTEAEDIYFKNAYCHYHLGDYELASELFKNFSATFINSLKREEAEYMSVYSIYKTSPNFRLDQSSTLKAIDGLQLFINTYPESPRVKECNKIIDLLRGKLELKALEQGKLYFNMKSYQSCVRVLENMLTEFPDTKNHREVRYLIVKASFELAKRSVYERQKERLLETINRGVSFIKKYPSGLWHSEVNSIIKQTKNILKQNKYE